MKKRALGKGLKAFIPEEYGILKEERYSELDIEGLKPNPLQPRLKFAQDSIDELARSIKESGILQPIVVTPEGDHYKIIVGERRWLAAQKIGLKKIPAIIRSMTKEKQLEASLIENLQRENLNPLEVALAYQKLIQELHYTQQDVAEKVGKDRTSVTNYLRLLKLPKEIQKNLAENKISMGHARALIALENPDLQISLSRKIIEKELSVREVERLIGQFKRKPSEKKTPERDPDLMAFQEELLKLLSTKVAISGNEKKGIIKIYYFSMDDLNRIYDRIKGVN
ncbi:MAG: ParB/RepB/Spo0J family partition protein [Candidatus Aminicenantes bacterium]|nr:MAG: ParB/RepB/Spo0J family partition protein [Candidatus Aminicenantes bacterium]